MARIATNVAGGVAVGPAEAGLGAQAELKAGFGPGTPSRWALIWFGLAVVYILLVAGAAARR